MKSLDQEVFDTFFQIMTNAGCNTYLGLPPNKAKYPCGYIGDVQVVPRGFKSGYLGTVYVTCHVFGEKNQRKKVSAVCQSILHFSRMIELTTNKLKLFTPGSDIIIRSETDSKDVTGGTAGYMLWHGRIQLELKIG